MVVEVDWSLRVNVGRGGWEWILSEVVENRG